MALGTARTGRRCSGKVPRLEGTRDSLRKGARGSQQRRDVAAGPIRQTVKAPVTQR